MSQFHYRPAIEGGWLAVAMDAQLLLVHPRALDIGVSVFLDAKSGGMSSTLDELTRGGLSATPEFALLELTGAPGERAVRVIIRGGVRVTVTAVGSRHTLDGTGVSTWTEQSFTGVTDFEVDVIPEPQALSDDWLPLQRGTAIVSRLRSSVASAPESPEAPARLDAAARPTDDGYDYLFGETMYRNVADATVTEPAPRFYLELPMGGREQLNQPLLVGRAPRASTASGESSSRLVTIPGDKDISRNHAQFTVEGATVVVTDLHSRNGTQIIPPGKEAQQLRPGEPTAVIVGAIVDLGSGVTFTVREQR